MGNSRRVYGVIGLSLLLILTFPLSLAHAQASPELDALFKRINELYRSAKYSEATPLAQNAIELAQRTHGVTSTKYADALLWLANLYKAQGRYADAEPLYKRCLTIRETALGANHPDVAESLGGLGVLYWDQGRHAEAEPLYRRSLAIR